MKERKRKQRESEKDENKSKFEEIFEGPDCVLKYFSSVFPRLFIEIYKVFGTTIVSGDKTGDSGNNSGKYIIIT